MLTELRTIKKQETKKLSPVTEVVKLLEYEGQKDLNVLRNISPKSQVSIMEANHGKIMDLEKLDKKYENDVFTIDQIKSLAINYNLRFLNSQFYQGNFDAETALKIRNFSEKAGVELNNATFSYKFFILAPAKMFQLQEKKYVTKFTRFWEDPAIFYKIDDNHYKLIHKWGNDFNLFRFIGGFKNRGPIEHFFFNFLLFLLLTKVIAAMILSPELQISCSILITCICTVISIVISFICIHTDQFEVKKGFYSPDCWNSEYIRK